MRCTPCMPARWKARFPVSSGQDAFGAIQEIVARLEADPATDWSKVNLEALRQHLIDMNEVTLRADAAATPVAGGLSVAITGRAAGRSRRSSGWCPRMRRRSTG